MVEKAEVADFPGRGQYRVFLSYAHEDREWVSDFAQALHDEGVSDWFDAFDIQPGERWQDRIEEALRTSRTFVVVLSAHSIQRPWTLFELGAAVADRKQIIPVITDDTTPEQVPLLLRKFQFLRESSARKAGQRVAQAIHHLQLAA